MAAQRQQPARSGHQQPDYGYEQYEEEPARPAARSARRPRRSKGGLWRVVLQFAVGLLVIAGVAAAIVALYIRYYQ